MFSLLIFFLYLPASAWGGNVSVRAAVESREVYLGEPFIFQIQVEGKARPGKPDLSALSQDFFVEDRGSQQNNSTSITIVNGRMQRIVKRGYIFSYRLTPRRAGTLKIPPLPVKVGGTVFNTQSLSVHVRLPGESKDFKLWMSLSRQKAYVGELLTLKIIWYIGKNVEQFRFDVPFLRNNPDFKFAEPQVPGNQTGKYFKIPLAGKTVTARQGEGMLKGRSFTTLSFAKIVIPQKSGAFKLSPARVFCRVPQGYRRSRPGAFSFNNNFFGFGEQKVYKRYLVSSNTLSLTVLDLPARGKPPDFSGLVGKYKIVTSAAPTEVKVGDPITLTMKISASSDLKMVPPPDLNRQKGFPRRFKVPREISFGKVEGKVKVFTRTIRARNDKVTEIPPVKLDYFNPENGRYEVAMSAPIPLTVQRTKVITLANAEGINNIPEKSALQTLPGGIAYNYEGPDVLRDQGFSLTAVLHSRSWLGALFGPLAFYLIGLFALRRRERIKADVSGRRKRAAYKKVSRGFRTARNLIGDESGYYEELIKEVRNYLADKCSRPASGLTFSEVERLLPGKGVDAETLSKLKHIFAACDAGRFGVSGSSREAREELLRTAGEVVKDLEKWL